MPIKMLANSMPQILDKLQIMRFDNLSAFNHDCSLMKTHPTGLILLDSPNISIF